VEVRSRVWRCNAEFVEGRRQSCLEAELEYSKIARHEYVLCKEFGGRVWSWRRSFSHGGEPPSSSEAKILYWKQSSIDSFEMFVIIIV
jgi:hypothetical protein